MKKLKKKLLSHKSITVVIIIVIIFIILFFAEKYSKQTRKYVFSEEYVTEDISFFDINEAKRIILSLGAKNGFEKDIPIIEYRTIEDALLQIQAQKGNEDNNQNVFIFEKNYYTLFTVLFVATAICPFACCICYRVWRCSRQRPYDIHDVQSMLNKMEKRASWAQNQDDMNAKYDIFVVYAYENIDFVEELVERIENQGFKVCLADRDFLLGTRVLDNIYNGIFESKAFILLVSRSFLKSDYCNFEALMIHLRIAKESLPVSRLMIWKYEECDIDEKLRYLHPSEHTYVNWSEERNREEDRAWNQLQRWIEGCGIVQRSSNETDADNVEIDINGQELVPMTEVKQ